jgi:hypothetical protein
VDHEVHVLDREALAKAVTVSDGLERPMQDPCGLQEAGERHTLAGVQRRRALGAVVKLERLPVDRRRDGHCGFAQFDRQTDTVACAGDRYRPRSVERDRAGAGNADPRLT